MRRSRGDGLDAARGEIVYQLVMTLITIGLFAALLLAGQSYLDPQRIVSVERAEFLLAERNRINIALRAYRVANGVPLDGTGWEERVTPFLKAPIRPLPDGMSWTLRSEASGGSVCIQLTGGVSLPPMSESVTCELSGPTACYDPLAVGLIGQPGWTGCEGMLIVDDALLRSVASPAAGGDGSFALTGPDGETYGFGAGARTVFTGQVTDMSDLFEGTLFNGDLSHWLTGRVTTMSDMFRGASVFNQAIGEWDTSQVVSMDRMFDGAADFNQDLSGWCVPLIGSAPPGFDSGAASWTLARPLWGGCPSGEPVISVTLGAGSVPDGEIGVTYPGFDFSGLLTLSGTEASALSWTVSTPPPGLALNPSGVLTGTPTQVGGFSFAVGVSHTSGVSDARNYTIIINDPDGALIVEP
ncbi:uncharacterized protein DUF285 [Gemmobacter caeni]|uniref:Uncharacterized protein DUF285 n=1 Tax=Gemmobacter caeni TaxID=589035 RepID=A0A2T6B944_9RHOB|nr:BspA family leucine-rich repeat surface protein [Gemmobacter caeni]PTX52548.1 uncharacterized protein DUF285 [Gemmobacter caeni]TWJ02781.1 uncharacterized protein DUF285 [Gemmobacter caeni]